MCEILESGIDTNRTSTVVRLTISGAENICRFLFV